MKATFHIQQIIRIADYHSKVWMETTASLRLKSIKRVRLACLSKSDTYVIHRTATAPQFEALRGCASATTPHFVALAELPAKQCALVAPLTVTTPQFKALLPSNVSLWPHRRPPHRILWHLPETMPGNVRRWLLRVRMREIDEKREIKRIQLPLRFWACEIGAKWWAKRIPVATAL